MEGADHGSWGGGGRAGHGAPVRKRKGKSETGRTDIMKKKENRLKAKTLLHDLWALEAKMRRMETPARAPGRNKLHSVLGDLVTRVKGLVQQPAGAVAAPKPPVQAAVPSAPDVRKGLLSSCSVGALYLCVDDWHVRECSKGMELLCPFEMLRGYVGYELSCFVHSDDHPQLNMLRLQMEGFRPGSSAPTVASFRLLRVCLDGGVLVMGYAQLLWEVVHVGRDEARGGKLHALMTCLLEPASVAPLTFTTIDRLSFQVSANTMSSSMGLVSHRGTRGDAATEASGGEGSTIVHTAMAWLLRIAGQTGTFSDILTFARASLFPIVKNFIKLQALIGLAPDGVPWVYKSSAVEALGISSAYKPYFVARMSGDINWIPFWSKDLMPFLVGVLKDPAVQSGAAWSMIGVVGIGFESDDTGAEKRATRRIIMHTRQEWVATTPPGGWQGTMSNLLWRRDTNAAQVAPALVEVVKKRIGPPNPLVLAEFFKFDKQKVYTAPPAARRGERSGSV